MKLIKKKRVDKFKKRLGQKQEKTTPCSSRVIELGAWRAPENRTSAHALYIKKCVKNKKRRTNERREGVLKRGGKKEAYGHNNRDQTVKMVEGRKVNVFPP
jgi:hypothetical protein